MSNITQRITKLETAQRASRQTGQTVERFTAFDDDGSEVQLVQPFWNGVPNGKPWLAELWDAWPEPGEVAP